MVSQVKSPKRMNFRNISKGGMGSLALVAANILRSAHMLELAS